MTTDPLAPALAVAPVIAILRSRSPRHFAATADALHEAGIRAVEFTLTTPGVLHALREYAESKPAGTALGAGTVMTPSDAMRAVEAGATYLITPATCLDVIREARRLGVPVLPGALTPSEIVEVWRAGATMVKLFPASAGGPDYLRAVRAPLPNVPLIPTGGIGLDQAPRLSRGRRERTRHGQPADRRRLRGRRPGRPAGTRRHAAGRHPLMTALVTLGETMAVLAADRPGPLASGASLRLGFAGGRGHGRHRSQPPRPPGVLDRTGRGRQRRHDDPRRTAR
ncbi:hypothetical protein GCM10020254_03610 [Streptomyces goshikiensis]